MGFRKKLVSCALFLCALFTLMQSSAFAYDDDFFNVDTDFKNGVAGACNSEGQKFINVKGEDISPDGCIFREIIDTKLYLFEKKGDDDNFYVYTIKDGADVQNIQKSDLVFKNKMSKKYIYPDTKEKFKIGQVGLFSDGCRWIFLINGNGEYFVTYFDKDGNALMKPFPSNQAFSFYKGVTWKEIKDSDATKYILINKKGEPVNNKAYDEVVDISEDIALVSDDLYYGYVDANGNEITPIQYGYAKSFHEGLAPVRYYGKDYVGGYNAYIDNTGKIVKKYNLDSVTSENKGEVLDLSSFSGGYAVVEVELEKDVEANKVLDPLGRVSLTYQVIDKDFNIVSDFKPYPLDGHFHFTLVSDYFRDGLIESYNRDVWDNNKIGTFGFYDKNGKLQVPVNNKNTIAESDQPCDTTYSYLTDFDNGYAVLYTAEKGYSMEQDFETQSLEDFKFIPKKYFKTFKVIKNPLYANGKSGEEISE